MKGGAWDRPVSRRRVLRLAATLPAGMLLAACGGNLQEALTQDLPEPTATRVSEPPPPPPETPEAVAAVEPTATPEPPRVIPAGEDRSLLMPGTPYETPFYVFGSGLPGAIVMVLGGVHGNEPGGWLAAEYIVDNVRPETGALLVVPRANKLATQLFARTTDDLGDLNRLYPGDPDGIPMARMAHEIIEKVREYEPAIVLDLHESWAFFRDRTATQGGTAFLGQTLSSSAEPGISIAREVVDAVNERILYPHEELYFREWPGRNFVPPTPTPGGTASESSVPPGFGGGRSSLGIPAHVPGVAAILVEMGQQQEMERRVALHVEVVRETMQRLRT